jgi:hypothetical protein
MTNEIGFLRQVPAKGAASGLASKYQLSEYGEVAIGRDRNCQIALEGSPELMVIILSNARNKLIRDF